MYSKWFAPQKAFTRLRLRVDVPQGCACLLNGYAVTSVQQPSDQAQQMRRQALQSCHENVYYFCLKAACPLSGNSARCLSAPTNQL